MVDELDLQGPGAPPRDNGELVFGAPWQSRAFGVTVGLHEAGHLSWEEFRQQLIDELAGGEAPADEYWAAWLRATETVVLNRRLVPREDLGERLEHHRHLPADHDHHDRGVGDEGHAGLRDRS